MSFWQFGQIGDVNQAFTNAEPAGRGNNWAAELAARAAPYCDEMQARGRARLDLAYGDGARNRLDLFLPEGAAQGLVVFVHGGYWRAFDKSLWSHLAAGAVARGYAFAVPSYTLCPENRVSGIVAEVAAAIGMAAGLVGGRLVLCGHSAGGHLVTRMVTSNSPLGPQVLDRIEHVVSISGVHDLRPLLGAALNDLLHLTPEEAAAESPVLLTPRRGLRLTAWVGESERHEFLRQSRLLADMWSGLGARTRLILAPDQHHFSVIDALSDADSELTTALLG